MVRKVPVSPARAQAALDDCLAQAPRPALPPGLAARIVVQATALPQLPAEHESVAATPAESRAPAQIIPLVASVPRPTPSRRRGLAGAGIAAMAASLLVAVMLNQPGDKSPGASAPVIAQAPAAPASSPALPEQPTPETRFATSITPARATSAAAKEPAPQPSAAPVAQPVQQQPETQLAVSAPPAARESSGPAPDPAPRTPPRILMGPPAPQQGWGFNGGAPGSGPLPGGQAMPSQTTGTMPPPAPSAGTH